MAPPTEPRPLAQVVLLAGASGSGKSRVARLADRPQLALDDFYYEGGRPDLPRLPQTGTGPSVVDWDDPASWDAGLALATVARLCRQGSAEVPRYDISASARTGSTVLDLGAAPCFVAEGVFAPELVEPCRTAGLPVVALWLDRPRTATAVLRLLRDLREHRKPVGVLLRRGLALWRAEPGIRRRALAAGCRPVTVRKALDVIDAGARLTR